MNNPKLFCDHFLKIMLNLADDKVLNVKLVLAQTVRGHIQEEGPMSQH